MYQKMELVQGHKVETLKNHISLRLKSFVKTGLLGSILILPQN